MTLELKKKVDALPGKPGVYLFSDAKNQLLYVGKARNLRSRVRSYFQTKHKVQRISKMVRLIDQIDIIVTHTEGEALLLENSLIKNNKPRFNVLLRDDKTYPYIKITRERFPRVVFTRLRENASRAKYFGPFPSARSARNAIHTLHQHFKVRQCALDLDKKSCAPCLQYHIKRCDAPCAGLVTQDVYGEGIRRAMMFLEGKTDDLIDQVSDDMAEATRLLEFEKAAYLRDLIVNLRSTQRVQTVANLPFEKVDVIAVSGDALRGCIVVLTIRNRALIRSAHFSVNWEDSLEEDATRLICHYILNHPDPPTDLLVPDAQRFEALRDVFQERHGRSLVVRCPKRGAGSRLLKMAKENAETQFFLNGSKQDSLLDGLTLLADELELSQIPRRMECFDISHTQGELTVASMVCFENGRPDKKNYRHFNIKTVSGIDDVASMKEVVTRRYKRILEMGAQLPDLIVVDGGLGQLHASHQALSSLGLGAHPLISLAKKEEQIFVCGRSEPICLKKNHPGLHVLQHIRDEAHRFGVTFHRKKRRKAMLHSEMDDIPGLGPKRIKKLLRHFGSIKGIRAASLDQMIQALGPKMGRKIFDHFRQAVK